MQKRMIPTVCIALIIIMALLGSSMQAGHSLSDLGRRDLIFLNRTEYPVNVNVEFYNCEGLWIDIPKPAPEKDYSVGSVHTRCWSILNYIQVIIRDPMGEKILRYAYGDARSRRRYYDIETVDNGRYYQIRSGNNLSPRVPTGK